MSKRKPVFVFVSGGVISGLGKGITTASVALLLKSAGFKVSVMKVDMYLNQDAGTMNPLEHGEVFVTEDGVETDQDIGHYERFLNQDLRRDNYMTAGQIYRLVLEKERRLEYQGRCIDAYLEIPQEVVKKWEAAAEGSDFFLIEMGGTVGEYQNVLFFEAARRLKIKYPQRVFFVHVVYLPIPPSLGEMKSKPAQTSILALNSLGIFPDIVVCRAQEFVDSRRKRKIALAAALPEERVFSAPDVKSIYQVPLVLEKQKLARLLLQLAGFRARQQDLKEWKKQERKARRSFNKKVRVAVVGKYYRSGGFSLEDSYVSVVEAIRHASWSLGYQAEIVWLDSESLERKKNFAQVLGSVEAVIVPGGFGSRGVEGKILAIKWAREKKIPFLGLCFGMQLAVVEYARHVLGWREAHTTEVEAKTKFPVIHLMSEQEKKMLARDYGGTMRLGAWPCWLRCDTLAAEFYTACGWTGRRGKKVIWERHRHRWEFNNRYRQQLEKAGLVIAGTTPDNKLVEVVELSGEKHPFFVGVQFHPEFKSRFLAPHPLFVGLIRKAKE